MKKVIDLLVRLLAAARLTRLVTADDLGERYVIQPAARYLKTRYPDLPTEQHNFLVQALWCPHCVSFWVTALTLVLPDIRPVRFLLRALAASYAVGHLSAQIDS